jgi:hypothetical protein
VAQIGARSIQIGEPVPAEALPAKLPPLKSCPKKSRPDRATDSCPSSKVRRA